MNSSNNSTTLINQLPEEQIQLLNFVNFYINDILGSILFTIGLVFNLLSFTYFQLSKSFKETSMRHYFSVISISDSLRLSEWLFAFLVDKNILQINISICRAYLFVVLTSGHISIWLLVFLSIERYIILEFPFRGKRIYTARNSLRMLVIAIIVLVIIDIPYLTPNFVKGHYVNYDLHLVMCLTNPKHRTYMFVNNVLIYALIPFFLLLIFNSLLISLLARQKTQFFNVIQSANAGVNAKRERQFKETTILLIVVTFFLLITVSPRYIIQMIFMFISYQNVPKIIIAKCLNVLEMFNFSLNFFFYILCSKTSRKEFYLILYYLFYWKWSKEALNTKICNHSEHNKQNFKLNRNSSTKSKHYQSVSYTNNNLILNDLNEKKNMNFFNFLKKKSRLKIYCFLEYSSRNKTSKFFKSNVQTTNTNNLNDSQISIDDMKNNSRYLVKKNLNDKIHKAKSMNCVSSGSFKNSSSFKNGSKSNYLNKNNNNNMKKSETILADVIINNNK